MINLSRCCIICRMPHRSRLAILLLDLPSESHAAGLDFWSGATGHPVEHSPAAEQWASLGSFADGFHLEVQRTGAGTPPRWHVDVETDDIQAEVARLEALGATRHRDMGRFWQMLDPAGLVFCVVGVQTGAAFEKYATTWP
jgi:predicted enzyme related to lactoylglutathione lyase